MSSYAIWRVDGDVPCGDCVCNGTFYFVTDSATALPDVEFAGVRYVHAVVLVSLYADPSSFRVPYDSYDRKLHVDTSIARVLRC